MKPLESDMTDELLGRFQVMKQLATADWLVYGTHWALTAVLRTLLEQVAYYAQGREPLLKVNQLRKIARMYPIGLADYQTYIENTSNWQVVL